MQNITSNFNDMGTDENKRKYMSPTIGMIKIDNEISLNLQSADPPYAPNESMLHSTDYFRNDPFNANAG